MLNDLEAQARERGLLLRLKVGRPLGLWSLRLVVAEQLAADRLQLQGEMKAWAYGATTGLCSYINANLFITLCIIAAFT